MNKFEYYFEKVTDLEYSKINKNDEFIDRDNNKKVIINKIDGNDIYFKPGRDLYSSEKMKRFAFLKRFKRG